MKKSQYQIALIIVNICLTLIISGCSSSDKPEIRTAETVFDKGYELFKNEEYLEAKDLFDAIQLQYPASKFADDAQYYSAECYFLREEYITAAYKYNLLRRVYPNSQFYKESFYKTGLCYYELSPAYDRDQNYTRQAIQTLSEFQSVYPEDSLGIAATNYIQELRDRLGEREYFTAELYRKLRSPNSALIYYESILNDYDDTKFYESAFLGKIEVLIEMKKYDKALNSIDLYLTLFKNGDFINKVKNLESSIPTEFKH